MPYVIELPTMEAIAARLRQAISPGIEGYALNNPCPERLITTKQGERDMKLLPKEGVMIISFGQTRDGPTTFEYHCLAASGQDPVWLRIERRNNRAYAWQIESTHVPGEVFERLFDAMYKKDVYVKMEDLPNE